MNVLMVLSLVPSDKPGFKITIFRTHFFVHCDVEGSIWELILFSQKIFGYTRGYDSYRMKLDAVKYVKETFLRVGYECEMNFDPLLRRYIFSGYPLITCSK